MSIWLPAASARQAITHNKITFNNSAYMTAPTLGNLVDGTVKNIKVIIEHIHWVDPAGGAYLFSQAGSTASSREFGLGRGGGQLFLYVGGFENTLVASGFTDIWDGKLELNVDLVNATYDIFINDISILNGSITVNSNRNDGVLFRFGGRGTSTSSGATGTNNLLQTGDEVGNTKVYLDYGGGYTLEREYIIPTTGTEVLDTTNQQHGTIRGTFSDSQLLWNPTKYQSPIPLDPKLMYYIPSAGGGAILMTISEAIAAADTYASRLSALFTVSETAAAVDAESGKLSTSITISEAASSSDSEGAQAAMNATIAEALVAADLLSGVIVPSGSAVIMTVGEAVAAADNLSFKASFTMSISETASAVDSVSSRAAFAASIAEAVSVTDTVVAFSPTAYSLTMNESVLITDLFSLAGDAGIITATISIIQVLTADINDQALVAGDFNDIPVIDGKINDIPVIIGTITVS